MSSATPSETNNALGDYHKTFFRSMQRHPASAIDLRQVLPDFLQLRILTDEQVAQMNQLGGVASAAILRALEDRVGRDRHVFPLILSVLRKCSADDEVQRSVGAEMSRVKETSVTEQRQRNKDGQSHHLCSNRNVGRRYGGHDKPPSPYFHRPFTIRPSNDPENIKDIRRNYLVQTKGAYFSKASQKKHTAFVDDVTIPTSCDRNEPRLTSSSNDVTNKETKAPGSETEYGESLSMKIGVNSFGAMLEVGMESKINGHSPASLETRSEINVNKSESIGVTSDDAGNESETSHPCSDAAPPVQRNDHPSPSIPPDRASPSNPTSCPITPPHFDPPSFPDVTSRGISSNAQKVALARDQTVLLELIQQRFSAHSAKDVINGDALILEDLLPDDINAYVKELVSHCIVSTRTAWIIRRCAKLSDRVRLYLELMAALKPTDINNLMNFCPRNKKFVERILGSSPPLSQRESEPPSSDVRYESDGSCFAVTLQSHTERPLDPEAVTIASSGSTVDDVNSDDDVILGCGSVGRSSKEAENRGSSRDAEKCAPGDFRSKDKDGVDLKGGDKQTDNNGAKEVVTGNDETKIVNEIDQMRANSFVTKQKVKSKLTWKPRPRWPQSERSRLLFPITSRKKSLEQKSIKTISGNTGDASVSKSDEHLNPREEPAAVDEVLNKDSSKYEDDNALGRLPLLSSTPVKSGGGAVDELRDDDNWNKHKKRNNGIPSDQIIASPPSSHEASPTYKKRHRVSFSDLPPIEFPFSGEASVETPMSDCQHDGGAALSSANLEKEEESTLEDGSDSNGPSPPLNEGDRANELLADILEEIEAENILLSDCLTSWVAAGLLSDDAACFVSVKYQSASEHPGFDSQGDATNVDCIGKLVDVLTDLSLETLSKCRNLVLDKLCQLSSREEYEIVQKAAACGSVPSFHCSVTKNASDKVIKNESNEVLRDNEADGRHSNQVLHDKEADSCHSNVSPKLTETNQEERQATGDVIRRDEAATSSCLMTSQATPNVIQLATRLVDSGVVSARQMWRVLCAGGEQVQRVRLRRILGELEEIQLNRLYKTQDLEALKKIMEEGDVGHGDGLGQELLGSNLTQPSPHAPETHWTEAPTHRTSRVNHNHSAVEESVHNHSTTKRYIPANNEPLSSSQTISDATIDKNISLEGWCQRHYLIDQSATTLRNCGYTDPPSLIRMTEDDVELLPGLSWLHKAKLWVAVETLRSDEHIKLDSDLLLLFDK